MVDSVVGLSTGSFYQLPIFDVLEPIRNMGFRVIEISASTQHLDYRNNNAVKKAARMIKRLGLHPLSFHAPFGAHIDITSFNPGEQDDSIQEIVASLKAAAVLGARYLIVHPGPDKEKAGEGEHAKRLTNGIQALREISTRCRELAMGLVLENMLPHLAIGQSCDVSAIIEALNPIEVGACLDTGHAYIGGNLIGDLFEMANHLLVVHANDNMGRRDDHFPPGRGKIYWKEVFAALRSVRYKGPLILELNGEGNKLEQTLAGAQEAFRLITNS